MGRLIIEGNSVYEIDEECERRKAQAQNGSTSRNEIVGHRRQNDPKNEQREHQG